MPRAHCSAAALRADGVTTPVLLLSAKDGEVDQADGLDLGDRDRRRLPRG